METKVSQPSTLRFIFQDRENPYANDVDLSFSINSDLTAKELRNFCKKFALALDFMPATIDAVFGRDDDEYDGEENEN